MQIAPQSSGTRALLGQLLVDNRDYQQGIAELTRALAFNPRLASAYEYRAIAYKALGNTARAATDARAARMYGTYTPNSFIDDISFLNQ